MIWSKQDITKAKGTWLIEIFEKYCKVYVKNKATQLFQHKLQRLRQSPSKKDMPESPRDGNLNCEAE